MLTPLVPIDDVREDVFHDSLQLLVVVGNLCCSLASGRTNPIFTRCSPFVHVYVQIFPFL